MKALDKLKTISFYPFLFAAFPILFFFQNNIEEVLLGVVFKPLGFVLALTGLGFFILRFIFGSGTKAGVFLSVLVGEFFAHDRLHTFLGENYFRVGGFTIGTDDILFSFYLVLNLALLVWFLRTKKGFSALTGFLNVAALVLVGTSVFPIASYELSVVRPIFSTAKNFKTEEVEEFGDPDIYYFIFDGYGSNLTLSEFHGYDNRYFTDFLEENGFYVAYESRTNYPKTALSLASSLNLDYLDEMTSDFRETNDETLLYPLIENNKVVEVLRGRGYRYYHLGSWFEGTKENRNAAQNFSPSGWYFGEIMDSFSGRLLGATALAPVFRRLFPQTYVLFDFNAQHKRRIIYQFEKLKEVSQFAGPKFVFAHVLAPHRPFVFKRDCSPLDDSQAEVATSQNYLGQLGCTNTKIRETLEAILANPRPKVIIIQADEGVRFTLSEFVLEDGEVNPAFLRERFGILNAFYFSGVPAPALYHSISPVNSFRLIFKTYFGEELELLPDRNFMFMDYDYLYDFREVTDAF